MKSYTEDLIAMIDTDASIEKADAAWVERQNKADNVRFDCVNKSGDTSLRYRVQDNARVSDQHIDNINKSDDWDAWFDQKFYERLDPVIDTVIDIVATETGLKFKEEREAMHQHVAEALGALRADLVVEKQRQ